MLTYHFNKDKKLVNVESTTEYKPCNLLHVPNSVRLLLKECKGGREIKICYDVNKKEEKAFFKNE